MSRKPGKITFGIHLEHVNFKNVSPMRVTAKVTWQPTAAVMGDINSKNKAATDKFNEQTRLEYEKAFVEAARDRINKASNIEPRKFEELREGMVVGFDVGWTSKGLRVTVLRAEPPGSPAP